MTSALSLTLLATALANPPTVSTPRPETQRACCGGDVVLMEEDFDLAKLLEWLREATRIGRK